MDPLGHGAVVVGQLGDPGTHVALAFGTLVARTPTRGRPTLAGALLHRGSLLGGPDRG
jgi:hypothetical protein